MGNILTKQFYRQRKDFEDSCAGRDAGLTFPEGVICSTDIAYADDGIKAHMLDIYRPEDSQEKILPVIINVHGGGLIIGNKEFNRYFCALLCKDGLARVLDPAVRREIVLLPATTYSRHNLPAKH